MQVIEQQIEYRRYTKAMQKIEPLLKRNRLKNIEHNRTELLSAYLHSYEGWMSLDSSLSHIARATAIEPVPAPLPLSAD